MRRLLVFCAVAGAVLAAYAVAQNGSAGAPSSANAAFAAQWKRGSSTACPGASREDESTGHSAQNDDAAGCAATAAGLPGNARVVATGVAVRALAANPAAVWNGNPAEALEVTVADSPNRVLSMAVPAMTSLPAAQSKRGPSTACAGAFANGANAKSINSAHSAQDDVGCAATAMAVVAGVGQAGSLGDGGAATSAQLDLAAESLVERSGIAVAPDGTIFIADTRNSTIRSVGAAASSEPGVVRSVAGRWAARQNIALGQPMGIAVDRAGNLYIADSSAGAVDVLSAASGQLSTLAQVISPASIAVTPDGSEVFVASPATGGVFKITTGTRAIAVVGGIGPESVSTSTPGPCSGFLGAAQGAPASQVICPAGLAVDNRGDLFLADANGGAIIRVDAKTEIRRAITGGLSVPGAIALDAKGNLFVAEQGASRVIVLPDVTANSGNITLTAPAAFAAPCPQTTNPFTYCNMPSGGTSPTATFTLTNTSSTQITGIVITPATPSMPPKTPPTDFTVESTSCTVTLPANGTCSINVAFTPQGSGARTGTLAVTDSNSGDSATYDLAGTGDDYSLQLAGGQTEEVSVAQGGTATFKAMVAPDGVFGQDGEMVKFQCPSNLPGFATCAFSPCPVAITPGAAVAFSITFVTSSAAAPAPSVTPCSGSSGVGPGVTRNPTIILRAVPERQPLPARRQFPAAWWLALGAIALAIFAGGARKRGAVRVRYAFALAGLAVALLIGCHGYKAKSLPTTPLTPTGVTSMTILGNATDAGGNPLGTSRSLQVTLDVVTK